MYTRRMFEGILASCALLFVAATADIAACFPEAARSQSPAIHAPDNGLVGVVRGGFGLLTDAGQCISDLTAEETQR